MLLDLHEQLDQYTGYSRMLFTSVLRLQLGRLSVSDNNFNGSLFVLIQALVFTKNYMLAPSTTYKHDVILQDDDCWFTKNVRRILFVGSKRSKASTPFPRQCDVKARIVPKSNQHKNVSKSQKFGHLLPQCSVGSH